MNRLTVSVALSLYDHVRDLVTGDVRPEGLDLVVNQLPIEEIFFRVARHREWDVAEFSLAKYVALRSVGDSTLTALPVFPSRMFRQSAIFVRADSDLTEASQLAGKRVGIPEWSQTAAVYLRGWLAEQVRIPLDRICWFQGGVNEAGRTEKVTVALPPGVTCIPVADRSLTDLLISGEIDAVFSAHPPGPVAADSGEIRTLYSDTRAVEEAYLAQTGIFPIMHVVVLRSSLLEAHPWVAMSLYKGFTMALQRSLDRLYEQTASRLPLAFAQSYARDMRELFGGEPFSYGVEANRPTLEAFVRYAVAQGVMARRIEVQDLFARQVGEQFRV